MNLFVAAMTKHIQMSVKLLKEESFSLKWEYVLKTIMIKEDFTELNNEKKFN
tara:strand:- start:1251 stop:1406 length:156 start_codon:yes stop_codon:yes gene_type:complete